MFLSPPQQSHSQTVAIRLGITLLLLLIAVPLAIAAFGGKGKVEPIALTIAIALVALCAALWVMIGKTVLTVHQEGIRRATAFRSTEIAWEDVAETRYRAIPIQAGGLLGAAALAAAKRAGGKAAVTSLRLTVIAKDGSRILITSNYRQASDAMGLILGKVQPPMLASARRRVEAGETVVFGPLSVSRIGVAWKRKDPVPFAELSSARIVGQYLRLRRKGKLFDIAKVRTDKVPDVLVFMDLLEAMGAGAGETKSIDPLARVQI